MAAIAFEAEDSLLLLLKDGTLRRRRLENSAVEAVDIPELKGDHGRFLAASSDGTVIIASEKTCLRRFAGTAAFVPVPVPDQAGITQIIFDRRDHDPFIAWQDGAIRRIDLDKSTSRLVTKCEHSIESMAVSADGSRAACANRNMVTVWDTQTGRRLCEIVPAHLSSENKAVEIRALACSPHGEFVFTAGNDAEVKMWDAIGGQLLMTWQSEGLQVLQLEISPKGDCLVAAVDGGEALIVPLPNVEAPVSLFLADVLERTAGTRRLADGTVEDVAAQGLCLTGEELQHQPDSALTRWLKWFHESPIGVTRHPSSSEMLTSFLWKWCFTENDAVRPWVEKPSVRSMKDGSFLARALRHGDPDPNGSTAETIAKAVRISPIHPVPRLADALVTDSLFCDETVHRRQNQMLETLLRDTAPDLDFRKRAARILKTNGLTDWADRFQQ